MSKENDVEDLLGAETAKPAKAKAKTKAKVEAAPAPKGKAKAKAEAAPKAAAKAEASPAPKGKAKAAPAAKAEAADTPSAVAKREPIVFEDGERDAIAKRVKQVVKKPWNTKDLSVKLEVPTRKLRAVLYGMVRKDQVRVHLESSRALGMTVSPA